MAKLSADRAQPSRTGHQNFVQGAFILTVGMILVKLAGALFKVPLESIIGAYGMGLFNVSYHFYGPIHSLATAGLPIAISRMVSESFSQGRYREVRQIKRVSTPIFIVLGILGTILMMTAAPFYCRQIIGNENALLPMLVLAPAVLFSCLSSIYRGYCEGLKDMVPTAISEVIEAVGKVLFGLSAAVGVTYHLHGEYSRQGTLWGQAVSSADEAALLTLSYAVAGAIGGVTLGTLFSFLFLWIRFHRRGDGISVSMLREAPRPRRRRTVAKRLVLTALPIGVGAIATNIAGLVDTTFLQSRIAAILRENPQSLLQQFAGQIPAEYLRQPETIPNFLFGCYSMALTVYMLVPTITQAFSISALPNVTAVWVAGDRAKIRESLESVLRITAVFSLPAGIGISALAPQISGLLYGSGLDASITAQILFLLGFAAAAAALSTPVSSLLQAVGRMDLPVKMLLLSMGIKIAVNYVLCGIPEINVFGAGIGTLLCYLFLAVSELLLLKKVSGVQVDFRSVIGRPLLAAVFCGIAAYTAAGVVSSILGESGRLASLAASGAGILSGGAVYVIFLGILGCADKKDLLLLPKGEKIVKILEKHGWI